MSEISLTEFAEKAGIKISDYQEKLFEIYYDFLIQYNNKVNLTAITEKKDVYIKHFLDSVMILKYLNIPINSSLADIGTGAGFPSVPVKIMRPDINLTLIDSLNKRLVFLNELILKLGFDAQIIHQRAEDISKSQRESFDFVVSRAVANLRILAEFDLPYVKIGGRFIALKGKTVETENEIEDADSAITALGGKLESVTSYDLLDEGERSIVSILKTIPTPEKYPRKIKKIEKQRI